MASILDNLVAYWKLDESSGDAADSSGNSNTLFNGNTTAFATGKINNGADFERASSNYLRITDGAQTGLDLNSDFTMSFWWKPESFSNPQTLISKYLTTGDQRGYLVFLQSSDSTIRVAMSSGGTSGTTVEKSIALGTFTNGTFYHFFIIYDKAAGTLDIYKDNTQLGTQQTGMPTSIFNTNVDFQLGASGSNDVPSDPSDGILDEVGIWTRKFDSTDRSLVYNNGSGLSYPFTITTSVADTLVVADVVAGLFQLLLADTIAGIDSIFAKIGFRNVAKNLSSWINRPKEQ